MSSGEPQQPGQRKRPDYDTALKRMLTQAHDGFLKLLASDDRWIAERPTELQATARRADLVWEVESPTGEHGLLHIELQTQPDPNMGERMAEYGVGLWLRDHLPVHSIVVFLRPAATVPTSPFVIQWKGQETLRYSFGVIRLWEIPAEQVLNTTHYALWPLATLMAGASIERAVEIAERIADAPLPPHERSDLTALLLVLAGLRLQAWEVLAALRRNPMIDELVKHSSLAEEFFEEGLSQGRSEGRDEGTRNSIRVVLQSRFGTLPEDLLSAVAGIENTDLETLLSLVATGSLEHIRAFLKLS